MDITKAKGALLYTDTTGKEYYALAFKNDDERECASKIVEQLKGMTIREAQEFLAKVSEALIDVNKL